MILMLAGVNIGFNLAYALPAVLSMKTEFSGIPDSDVRWTVFTISTSGAAILGPSVTFVLLRFLTRRHLTFAYSVAATLIWLLVLLTSESHFTVGVVMRCLGGVVTGAFSSLIPMYLVEISPDELTSFFGCLNQLGIAVGWVLCYTVALPVRSWRALTGLGAAIPLLLALLVWLIPAEAGSEAFFPVSNESNQICSAYSRRWFVVCGLMMFFQQMTGINVVLTYLPRFFADLEDPESPPDFQLFASSLSSIAQVLACLFSAFLIARTGARIIWVISLMGVGVTDLLYAFSPKLREWQVVLVIFLFLLFFGLGAGPIPWFFPAQWFHPSIHPFAMAVIATINWVFAFILVLVREQITQEQIDSMVPFLVFSGMSFVGSVFGIFFVHNTPPSVRVNQQIATDAELGIE
jgi:MFS family permease